MTVILGHANKLRQVLNLFFFSYKRDTVSFQSVLGTSFLFFPPLSLTASFSGLFCVLVELSSRPLHLLHIFPLRALVTKIFPPKAPAAKFPALGHTGFHFSLVGTGDNFCAINQVVLWSLKYFSFVEVA